MEQPIWRKHPSFYKLVVLYIRTCFNADFQKLRHGQNVENVFPLLVEATKANKRRTVSM